MSRIDALLNKIKQTRADAEALLNAADEKSGGVMSQEDSDKFDELMAAEKQLKAQIDKLREFEESAQDLSAGMGRKVAPGIVQSKEMIEDDPKGGFGDIAEFANSVQIACAQGGQVDKRLNIQGAPTNFHRGTGADEGYMVPAQFREEIYSLVFSQDDDLLSLVDSEPTNSNTVQLNADESTPWGSTGVQAYWGAEGGQLSQSKLSTKQNTIHLNKVHAYVLATDELLDDAPRLANRLTVKAAEAINWKANDSIMWGTGAGQPLGFMNAGCLVSVAKESGQTADTLDVNNIIKMYSRMLANGLGRSIWIGNTDIVPQLFGLTVGDQPVWTTSNGLSTAVNGLILGRPLVLSEHAKTIGDKGDLCFIDPMGYYLARKEMMKFAQSMHLFFDYDIEAFRWTFRIGGQPYLSAAVSPANGSNTKSHFVTLDERA